MFKSPTLHFQALRSSELASGHLCLCHPYSSLGCQDYDLLLWPAPSTAPTISHKQTSKAFLVQRALHLLRAPGAATSLRPNSVFIYKQFRWICNLSKTGRVLPQTTATAALQRWPVGLTTMWLLQQMFSLMFWNVKEALNSDAQKKQSFLIEVMVQEKKTSLLLKLFHWNQSNLMFKKGL